MTMFNTPSTTAPRSSVAPRVSMLARLAHAHAVWCQRQKLKSLDKAALSDIGLTRAQAQAEAKRPLWDAPVGWTR